MCVVAVQVRFEKKCDFRFVLFSLEALQKWPVRGKRVSKYSKLFNNPSGNLINFGTIFGPTYGGKSCTTSGTTNLAIRHHGFHSSGASAKGARPTAVEAAEGSPHIGGWRDW